MSTDVVISFDTTGSMYPCLTQVRRHVEALAMRLFDEVPDLRLSVIAHGDYVDHRHPYTVKVMHFTNSQLELIDFIRDVERTHGGDSEECYELVLQMVHEMPWREDADHMFIMIGDDQPHEPGDHTTGHRGPIRIDWRQELQELSKQSIQVYAVHALAGVRVWSTPFYKTVAKETGGHYLTLDQFAGAVPLILGSVIHQRHGVSALSEYITEVRAKGNMSRGLERSFQALGVAPIDRTHSPASADADLVPVPSGRFQRIHVPITEDGIRIDEFIRAEGIHFEPGRLFYQLSKREKVQQHKGIILCDDTSKESYTGPPIRDKLGLPEQVDRHRSSTALEGRLNSKSAREAGFYHHTLFVQSTSYNRKLVGGTDILYEVMDV